MGRPALVFDSATRQQVATWAAGGAKGTQIARALGIHRNTVHRILRDEVAVGAAKARMDVAIAMYEAALRGNVSAARFFLRAPWRGRG